MPGVGPELCFLNILLASRDCPTCTTIDGPLCEISFKNGPTKASCTTHDGDDPWCNKIEGGWGYCDDSCFGKYDCNSIFLTLNTSVGCHTLSSTHCVFPFRHKESDYWECTADQLGNATLTWCATQLEGGEMVDWDFCAELKCADQTVGDWYGGKV